MHKVIKKYNLPIDVKFCKRCVISNQRPRIRFDEEGICSACRYSEKKKATIDWKKREKQLLTLLEKYRSNDGSYDVVVPASGGKDSGFVAHQLKMKYGMHPLTVTWAPHIYTDIGFANFQNFVKAGFDNITGWANGHVHRIMTRLAFEKLGDPFLPFIYGQKVFPIRIAVNFKIPLVMYGENGEVEYGGSADNEESSSFDILRDVPRHYFSNLLPKDLVKNKGIGRKDIYIYTLPEKNEIKKVGVACHWLGYYKKWVPQENFYYAQKYTGFSANPDGRSEGTYSKYASLDDRIDGFHFYLAYIKFGMGRATSDAAHEIRDGHITREEGVALVERYDGEFPKKYFSDFLDYCGFSEKRFWSVIDGFRPSHLWQKTKSGWKLRHRVS